MIVLDTCAIIFDALTPNKLTSKAKKAIMHAEKNNILFCCDISFWEIGMLIQKNRLDPGTDTKNFLSLILQSRGMKVLDITTDIATIATTRVFNHYDPADRLIAATAIHYQANLITCDQHLKDVSKLSIIW